MYASIQLSNIKTSKNTLNELMKISDSTKTIFVTIGLVRKIHSKCMLKWFTTKRSASYVICVIIQLSNMHTLEDTLNVSMITSNSTNVVFVNRALAKKEILEITSKPFMKTRNLSDVIYVIIQLSNTMTLKIT
jgi:hypothetical protein